ncbi:MAG: hypothetical protein IT294_05015 [Deltaproteobacteria bacterium]|nr:hypothetical protein [Deltaproteobacteria bacterium]
MPSSSPPVSPAPAPAPAAAPHAVPVTLAPPGLWPTLGPSFPNAGAAGAIAIALAYFSLGVALGALLKQSPGGRRWLPFVVVPGLLAGLGFLAWVIRSLR